MTCNLQNLITRCFDFLAGEWILGIFKSNGGAVVALRALWTTAIFAVIAVIAVSAFDPERIGPATVNGALDVLCSVSSSVVIFLGASYVALYARFVSQWGYLAGLYNMIKQTEATQNSDKKTIAEWKAGYLEDAENLHLAAKNNLAPVLYAWVQDPAVIRAYIKNTPGGTNRLRRLRCLACRAYEEEAAKWKS
jgi:Gpi18-like mannosyltransferase